MTCVHLEVIVINSHRRPKPLPSKPAYMDDPRGKKMDELPADFPKQDKRYGNYVFIGLGS